MKGEQYRVHASLGLRHWWHYGTKMFFLGLIKKSLPKGAELLDAGCGVGDMLMLLVDHYRVTGIDCSEDAMKYCAERGISCYVRQGDISNLPFNDGSFDGVLSLDVLYHSWVADDVDAAREMYRVLKPGGRVFIQLPAYEWLRSGHDEWAFSGRRYTATRLSGLLTSAGFKNLRVGYRVALLFPFAAARRLLFRHAGSDMRRENPFINSFLKGVMIIENAITLRFGFPFGLSVFGVAEK